MGLLEATVQAGVSVRWRDTWWPGAEWQVRDDRIKRVELEAEEEAGGAAVTMTTKG